MIKRIGDQVEIRHYAANAQWISADDARVSVYVIRTDEALVQLKHAVELTKNDATVFDHLADVLLKLGKTDEALLALRRAKELDPDNKGISEKLHKLDGSQSAAH